MGKKKEKAPQQPIKVDTRSSEQRAIESTLVPLLQRLLKEGRDPYAGERVAELTPSEQENIAGLGGVLRSARGGLEQLLSGKVPEAYFEKTVKAPLLRSLREDIIPLAEEGLVGRGTFQGSPLLRTRRKLMEGAFETLAAERGKLAKSAFEAPGKYTAPAAFAAQSAAGTFAQERAVNQARFDAAFQEFVRTEPGSAGALSSALSFLGIPMLGFVGPKGETENASGGALSGLGSIIGAVLSTYLGGS